jgi:5-formyltetrahydrofolate cyclo-ligase
MNETTREPLSSDARRRLREAVIERLRPFAWPDTRFVHDLTHFLPAYDGCEALTEVLPSLPFWPGAGLVYATPDNCLEGVRSALIAQHRPLLQVIAVRLGFRYFAPASVVPEFERLAGTLDGADVLSAPIDLAGIQALGDLDFIVTGCRAVTRGGVRLGKGFGYFDIEWGILSALGVAHDDTPIVVVCHDVQVLDDEFEPSPHDTLVDWIVTPTETIQVDRTRPKPSGIQWDRLQPEQLRGMPPLRDLQAMGL